MENVEANGRAASRCWREAGSGRIDGFSIESFASSARWNAHYVTSRHRRRRKKIAEGLLTAVDPLGTIINRNWSFSLFFLLCMILLSSSL